MKKPLAAELSECLCLGGCVEMPASSPQIQWALHTQGDPFSLSHCMTGDKLSSGPSFKPGPRSCCTGARDSAMLHPPADLYGLPGGLLHWVVA